ncbi:MAG: glutamate racemase [Nitrososphaeraceae archaeon]
MIYNPICVFDSGLGSLSIIRELRREIPHENLLYFADKSHFPYGTKQREELHEIITNTINYLEKYKPKLIIIASTTPSINVLDEIKKNASISLIGVRPPLKEACRLTKKKHIGIMATQASISSKALAEQIKKEVPQDILVTKINASPVIELVENGTYITNERRTFDVISNMIGDELDEKVDVITLSSTHLPFVKRYLSSLLPTVKFVDPAKIVSRDVKKFLLSNKKLRKSGVGRLEVFVSGGKRQFEQIIRIMGIREPVQEIALNF